MTSLPTPQQWVIKKMSEAEVAEMIERHIDFVDKHGRSVHLPTKFVRHYMKRDDGRLPTIVAVTTLPLVLADGHVLGARMDSTGCAASVSASNRRSRRSCRSRAASPTTTSKSAMQFLTDDWLCDVATDYVGKCTIIAAALNPDRALAARPAAGLLRHRRTPRWRQDHHACHADQGGHGHFAGRCGMVDQ